MRRSQRSLATQPAPLTAKPPRTIKASKGNDGGDAGLSQRAQPAGISKISLPLGWFQRSSSSPSRILCNGPGAVLAMADGLLAILVAP